MIVVLLSWFFVDAPVTEVTTIHVLAKIQSILQEFSDIFEEPIAPPPKRFCDHAIPLAQNAKAINQRSYRLPRH